MSVSYAVDFASLLALGADATMVVAAVERVRAEPLEQQARAQPAVPDAVQHCLADRHRAGRRTRVPAAGARRTRRTRWTTLARPLVGAATVYFLLNTGLIATAISLSSNERITTTWHTNFLWSAPSYFVGAGTAALAAVADRTRRLVGDAADLCAGLPDVPHLQGVHGPRRGRAAARPADVRSAPGDHRGAGAGDRRQGPAPRSRTSAACSSMPSGLAQAVGLARPTSRASRRPRCCTTSASWPCPSTSCRSPGR